MALQGIPSNYQPNLFSRFQRMSKKERKKCVEKKKGKGREKGGGFVEMEKDYFVTSFIKTEHFS